MARDVESSCARKMFFFSVDFLFQGIRPPWASPSTVTECYVMDWSSQNSGHVSSGNQVFVSACCHVWRQVCFLSDVKFSGSFKMITIPAMWTVKTGEVQISTSRKFRETFLDANAWNWHLFPRSVIVILAINHGTRQIEKVTQKSFSSSSERSNHLQYISL